MIDDRDLLLAAWIDGALEPDEAAAFEIMLAGDPHLAARARRWKDNDALIAATLALEADDAIEPALLRRLGLADPRVPVHPSAANDNRTGWNRRVLALGGALAACLALLTVFVPRTEPSGPDTLSYALETTPSGTQMKLADGRAVTPTLTVQAKDGRFCREYRIADRIGLACRGSDNWRIEDEAIAPQPDSEGGYRLAAGADASVLAAGYRRIGASDPFSRENEVALIGRKWQRRK